MKIVDERTKKSTIDAFGIGQAFLWESGLYMKTVDGRRTALALFSGLSMHFSIDTELEPVNITITIHD